MIAQITICTRETPVGAPRAGRAGYEYRINVDSASDARTSVQYSGHCESLFGAACVQLASASEGGRRGQAVQAEIWKWRRLKTVRAGPFTSLSDSFIRY